MNGLNLNEIKSLPKDYLEMGALKGLLGILAVITLGAFCVFITVLILYLCQVKTWVIVLSAWIIWGIFLAIIGGLYYFKQREIKKTTKMIYRLFNSNKAILSLGVSALTTVVNKLRKHHHSKHPKEPPIEE